MGIQVAATSSWCICALGEDGCVEDAAFQGEGCTISQAGASMLTENVVGKTLEEVREMSYEDVIEDMGREVVSSRTRCATLALSTMKAAIDDFSKDLRAAQITQEAS